VLQLDERRVADRLDDVVVDGHVLKIASCFLTAGDPKGPPREAQADAAPRSAEAGPRGNCFARSRVSWHNLARKRVRE
jgi:hypothetical protein